MLFLPDSLLFLRGLLKFSSQYGIISLIQKKGDFNMHNEFVDTGKDKKQNNENHSISHILITLCLVVCMACLYFSVNTFFLVKNYIAVETGRVQIDKVTVIKEA